MNCVWESNLITSRRGVYKNIDKQRGSLWDEVSISAKGFAKAIRNKPMFMNVNDRFSKVADKYKKQIKWFWDAMEKLYGVKMKLKIPNLKIPNLSWPRLYSPQKNIDNDQLDIKIQDITGRSKNVPKPTAVFWQRDAFTDPSVYEDVSGCEKNCRVVSNVKEADILISTHSPVTKVKNSQMTIHFSRESLKTHGKNIAQFDLTMDMSPLSNIPITSIPSNFWQTMHDMSVPTKDNIKKRKLAVWYGSNCDNTQWPRTKYLQKLSQYMNIDFPGKCLHNTDSTKSRSDFKTNADIYKKYLFVFGFHNALDNRNIDEKMFHAFMGNSVNVVMAHDIAYSFAPGKNSFVDASRFASPKELAEYLLYLQAHPDEYLKFFEYRKETTQPKVLAAIQETSIYQKGNLCRVCACVADKHCRAKRTVSQRGYEKRTSETTKQTFYELHKDIIPGMDGFTFDTWDSVFTPVVKTWFGKKVAQVPLSLPTVYKLDTPTSFEGVETNKASVWFHMLPHINAIFNRLGFIWWVDGAAGLQIAGGRQLTDPDIDIVYIPVHTRVKGKPYQCSPDSVSCTKKQFLEVSKRVRDEFIKEFPHIRMKTYESGTLSIKNIGPGQPEGFYHKLMDIYMGTISHSGTHVIIKSYMGLISNITTLCRDNEDCSVIPLDDIFPLVPCGFKDKQGNTGIVPFVANPSLYVTIANGGEYVNIPGRSNRHRCHSCTSCPIFHPTDTKISTVDKQIVQMKRQSEHGFCSLYNMAQYLQKKGMNYKDCSKKISPVSEKISPVSENGIDILIAPYGVATGLNRRNFHLDDSEPLNKCNKIITRHHDTSTVSDIIATADVVWMDCVWVHKNMKALRAKLTSLNIKKPKNQRWICASTETSIYYPHLYPFTQLRQTYPEIDFFSTNRLDSDIPLIEIGNLYGVTVDKLLNVPTVSFADKIPKVLTMYKNCNAKSGRQNYIKSFIDSYPSLVANYGKCWGGKSTNNAYTHNGVVEKLKRLGKHMFSFCIENSYVKDYVSEKVYQSLAEGSIPIYKGAPNAKDLIPCENCVIWVDDYPTADALANHLQYLIKNKDAYEEYFKWKKSPRMDVIQTLKDYSIDSALCRWSESISVSEPISVSKWIPFTTKCPENGKSQYIPLYGCSKSSHVYSNVPMFNAETAKTIIDKYRSIVFIGDSLTRHVFNAFMMIANGDAKKGALRGEYTFFKENTNIPSECEYGKLLTEKKQCFENMAWDNIYGYEQSQRANGCPYSGCDIKGGCTATLFDNLPRKTGNIILYTWYSATCRTHVQEVVNRLTSSDVVIMGEGIHDNFDFDKFTLYASDAVDRIQQQQIPLLILKAVAAGKNKPKQYAITQGTQAAMKFNEKLQEWSIKRGVQTLDSFDMTRTAKSFDGTHYDLDVNMMRASQVLDWLQTYG